MTNPDASTPHKTVLMSQWLM